MIKSSSTTVCGFVATDVQGVELSNLIFIGPNSQKYLNDGVFFFTLGTTGKKFSGITLKNLEISNFGGCGIDIFSYTNWSNINAKDGFRDILIDGCSVSGCRENGISLGGPDFTGYYQHANLTIRNSISFNNPGWASSTGHKGSGMLVSHIDSVLIERCSAYGNGTLNKTTMGPGGIWVYCTNKALIQYCESYKNDCGTGADGLGFDLDGGVTNSIIQYCYSHDNSGAGYLLGDYGVLTHPWTNNTVRYCLSVNDARKNNSPITLFTAPSVNWDGLQFYNNTVYTTPSATNYTSVKSAFQMTDYGTSMKNIKCYNNIFQTTGSLPLINVPTTFVSSAPSFIGNLYWTTGGTFKITYGSAYSTLASFRGTNRERINSTDYGLNQDPLLNSTPASAPSLWPNKVETLNAYMLTSTSPAKDAGLDLNALFGISIGLQDYWGILGKKGTAYDIGANEFDPLFTVSTDVAQANAVQSLTIYPNPCGTQATIEFANDQNEPVLVSIYDIAGNLILEKTTASNFYQFDGLQLPQGVYLVAVKGTTVHAVGKLIKK
jgi:Secretion system C-terminal sorting domain